RVEVTYPMSLHLAEANDDPNTAAVMYGALVLAGTMGTEGMTGTAPFSDPTAYNDYYTYAYNVPESIKTSLTLDKKNLAEAIQPVGGQPRVFITNDNILLAPIQQMQRQRYVVYWDLQ